MNLYDIAVVVTVGLTVVVVVLSVYALVTRLLSERRQEHALQLRANMRSLVERYISGQVGHEAVVADLQTDHSIAFGVLLEVSATHPIDGRESLLPLYLSLGLEKRALRAIRSRDPARRATAATWLGYMTGRAEGRDALRKALNDRDLDVRLAAAQAIVYRGYAWMTVSILKALALPGPWPLQRTSEILVRLGPAAIDPLCDFVRTHPREGSGPALQVAINVLGLLSARAAVPETLDLLNHPEIELRVTAAKALGGMGDWRATGPLSQVLCDPKWEVRSMAAKSLGQLRDPGAVDALERALADKAWWVRFSAAQALLSIGQPGIQRLRQATAGHQDQFARDISRQILEENGIARLGAGEAV